MPPQDVIRLSADIGGTFTDLVLDGPFGRRTRKVLTTVEQPEAGLMAGARQLINSAGHAFSDVHTFVHGTTLATNAVLERKGARTALISTDGFRDVLEIGTEGRFNQYDLQLEKPQPLIPRDLRFTVTERIDAQGQVRLPLDETAVRRLATALRSASVQSVAIAFLHAYANPVHEQRAAELLSGEMPELSISMSSDVCPEIREYERTSTTAGNAYVRPLIDSYLARMQAALDEAAFGGKLYLVTSGGGLTSIDVARRYPIRLVESGPAGGAIYAARRAVELQLDKVIAFDMGGTTAKVCLIRDGEPTTANSFEVDRTQRFMKGSGLPLRIPAVELVEIGAGGGSLAGVDRLGRVTVGPESAGSNPGPACYPEGGQEGTVTDADVILGLLDPDDFAGGRLKLRPDAAAAALDKSVGARLGETTAAAAYAVFQTVCESMASAVRVHAAERGEPISDYTMIAFGGAAPLHAATVADKAGVERIVVPANAGVGSAVGFLEAPLAFELVRSRHMRLDAFDPEAVDRLLSEMSREAHAIVDGGEAADALVERRTVFMRYVGQGHEIAITLPLGAFALPGEALRILFEREYEKLFTRCIPGAPIEALSWSVLVGAPPPRAAARPPQIDDVTRPEHDRMGQVYDGEKSVWTPTPVYHRQALKPGDRLEGPALVVETETTTFVSGRFDAVIDGAGCIVMQRKRG